MVEQKFSTKQQLYYYIVKRFLIKSVIPFAISAGVAYATKNPQWVALTPVLQITEKVLRDKGWWFNY